MRKLLPLIFLFFTCSVHAQKGEVKIDAFAPLIQQFNISYEWLFSDKLGIEGGIGYIYDPRRLDTIDFSTPLPPGEYGFLSFKQRSWSFFVSAKYYLLRRSKSDKFFIGTFIQYRTQPKIEDAYFESYEAYNNEPPRFTPNANLLVGGSIGYKILLFKQKIILEPILGLGINIEESELDIGGFGFSFENLVRLNVGFRF